MVQTPSPYKSYKCYYTLPLQQQEMQQDFGNLTQAVAEQMGLLQLSNTTHGVFAGGKNLQLIIILLIL